MRYPVKLAKEAGGVHETLKLPGSSGSFSAVRSVGLSAAEQRMIKHDNSSILYTTLQQGLYLHPLEILLYN